MAVRHFTATGLVVDGDRVLLHWHPKVKAWLPPGGHIEANEDPVQAVLREVLEESGVVAEVVPSGPCLGLDYPTEVAPPFTIMIEDIQDPETGFHQHIDMIYFCRLAGPAGPLNDGWLWAAKEDLVGGRPIDRAGAPRVAPPDDVRALALRAFDTVGEGQR